MPDYKSIYSGEQIDLAVGKTLTPDASPTTNSQNLVTSGGVKAAIDNATAEFGDIETRVESIEGKIPSGASSSNKLATASDVAAKYTKPGTGIPASDLASGVQTSLGKADSAYQKPSGGIPKTDLASAVQLSLQKADEAAPQSSTYNKTEVDGMVSDLDSAKSDKDGYTPSQRVGSADDVVLGERAWREEEIPFRRSGCPYERGNAVVRGAKGRSMAWNQLVTNGDFSQGTTGWTAYQCSIASSGGILTGTVTTKSNGIQIYRTNFNHPVNHYYYCNIVVKSSRATTISVGLVGSLMVIPDTAIGADTWAQLSGIIKATTAPVELSIYLSKTNALEVGDVVSVRSINLIDLTLLYGAGKEPATVAEFERTFPNLYYPYNAGKLIHNAANRIESVGRNVWDEEWEIGNINFDVDGQNIADYTRIRSKGYTPCFPSTTYYCKCPVSDVRIGFYNQNKEYISVVFTNMGNATFNTPSGAYFMRFRLASTYGTTYNHDICVNRSDSRNGLYTSYEKSVATIRFDAFKVKDANGNVLTVNGLKGAGTVFDERDDVRRKYIKRVGTVDLGTLDWTYDSVNGNMYSQTIPSKSYSTAEIPNMVCANYIVVATNSLVNKSLGSASYRVYVKDSAYTDAATFKTAMSGVELNYALATPEEYDLVDDINGYYKATSLGTEASAPLTDATGDPISLPFTGELGYGQSIGEQMDDKAGQNDYAPALVAGSADGLLGVSKAQEFTFAAVPEGTGNGAARIGKVKGNSLAWNQINSDDSRNKNSTVAEGATGAMTVTNSNPSMPFFASHKYLFKAKVTTLTANGVLWMWGGSRSVSIGLKSNERWSAITSPSVDKAARTTSFSVREPDVTGLDGQTFGYEDLVIFDLTLMFPGVDLTNFTVADFEKLFPELYYPQNNGAIINNAADTLVTDGFNQWDEEWRKGYYNQSGVYVSDANELCSKNMVKVLPNTSYYSSTQIAVMCYDINGTFIGAIPNYNNDFTTLGGCYYINFTIYPSYGTTYKNDIAISISSARNGQYEPHWRRTLPLALTSLRGRLNGTGERVAIFPGGMKRAGDAYDEVYGNIAIKRVGSVDMGDLTGYYKASSVIISASKPSNAKNGVSTILNSKYVYAPNGGYSVVANSITDTASSGSGGIYIFNDPSFENLNATQIKAALSGVELLYELATPEIYILDEPIPSGFAVGAGGTMHALPDAIDGTPTAPFVADIAFPRDNYGITSKNSTVALLEALKTAGKIASYTIGYDANGDMTFNIT